MIKVRAKEVEEGEHSGTYGDGTLKVLPFRRFPGDVFEIRDDSPSHTDQEGRRIERIYNLAPGVQKAMTEKEKRQYLVDTRKIQTSPGFLRKGLPSNEVGAYEKDQIANWLAYEDFAPTWMERVYDDTPTSESEEKLGWPGEKPATPSTDSTIPNIQEMTMVNIAPLVNKTKDAKTLEAWLEQEKAGKKRDGVQNLLISQIKNAYNV